MWMQLKIQFIYATLDRFGNGVSQGRNKMIYTIIVITEFVRIVALENRSLFIAGSTKCQEKSANETNNSVT